MTNSKQSESPNKIKFILWAFITVISLIISIVGGIFNPLVWLVILLFIVSFCLMIRYAVKWSKENQQKWK